MNRKQEVIAYFRMLEQQADFDHDGNAAAMMRGLWMDIDSTKPDTAFELRDTFTDGSELAARNEAHMTPEQEALDKTAAESATAAANKLAEEAAANAPPAEQVTPPAAVETSTPTVPVVAGDQSTVPGAVVTPESETDKKQDGEITALKERIDQLEAEKMASKLAPENAA